MLPSCNWDCSHMPETGSSPETPSVRSPQSSSSSSSNSSSSRKEEKLMVTSGWKVREMKNKCWKNAFRTRSHVRIAHYFFLGGGGNRSCCRQKKTIRVATLECLESAMSNSLAALASLAPYVSLFICKVSIRKISMKNLHFFLAHFWTTKKAKQKGFIFYERMLFPSFSSPQKRCGKKQVVCEKKSFYCRSFLTQGEML